VSQLPSGEGEDLKYTVAYLPELTYHWTLPNGDTNDSSSLTISPLTASDLGTYQIQITEGSCLHRTLSTSINSLVYGKPIIYELITPNGDGDNETFYIKNLDPSLTNEVSIFNAVHQVVYHQENYRNDWDGGNLPVGTYYYFVKLDNNTYKGNLHIKR
jgi:gliding motility-associated-like protein